MKKLTALILSLMLILSLSVPAMAAGNATVTPDGEGKLPDQTINVTAKYVDQTEKPDVYSVEIQWGSLEFTYTDKGTKTWNPTTHTYTYTDSGDYKWRAVNVYGGDTIKVTNHSNAAVTVACAFTPVTGCTFNGSLQYILNGSFVNDRAELAAWDSSERTNVVHVTLDMDKSTLDDSLKQTTGIQIGTVTVTIS